MLYYVAEKLPQQYAGVAQLVEQLIRNQQVVGSSPIFSSKKKGNNESCCFFQQKEMGLEVGAVVNEAPVKLQSRE